MKPTVAVGLLLLTGCEVPRNMRDDLARLTSPQAAAAQRPAARPGASQPARPRNATPAATPTDADPATELDGLPRHTASAAVPVSLAGKSEAELRALLGAPTAEEDRPPGKRWHYRDGQCTLDVQLYPDVQTKQFGTLAYEVKSHDNTDQGKLACLAQLQSRARTAN